MNKKETALELKNNILENFNSNLDELISEDTTQIMELRHESLKKFSETGFPSTRVEEWKKTNLKNALVDSYNFDFTVPKRDIDTQQIFQCEIYDFETDVFTMWNNWLSTRKQGLKKYDNGVVVGSIKTAAAEYPELFEKHFNNYLKESKNPLAALNTATFTDGLFIYVPDNVEMNRALQLIQLVDTKSKLFSNLRNLIVLGKNSKLQLVNCDDTLDYSESFLNYATEIYLDEGAKLDYYKLQNKDDQAFLSSITNVVLEKDSDFNSHTISLNGGFIRNDLNVKLNGKGANADMFGLYLMDKKQFVDNHVFVDHKVSDCTSNQLYKGITDDEAKAVFNGYVLVRKDAQRTNSYQTNNNIQLTKDASISSNPFLEIYADDVKCSHGSTIGQLDNEAKFYIKQRGICERTANQLLMIAFAGQVIETISIDVLKKRISDLVRRRLKGDLSACEQCSLQCTDPDKTIEFEIDMTKV
jgi:Fe-S cluster assembly protein SufD